MRIFSSQQPQKPVSFKGVQERLYVIKALTKFKNTLYFNDSFKDIPFLTGKNISKGLNLSCANDLGFFQGAINRLCQKEDWHDYDFSCKIDDFLRSEPFLKRFARLSDETGTHKGIINDITAKLSLLNEVLSSKQRYFLKIKGIPIIFRPPDLKTGPSATDAYLLNKKHLELVNYFKDLAETSNFRNIQKSAEEQNNEKNEILFHANARKPQI